MQGKGGKKECRAITASTHKRSGEKQQDMYRITKGSSSSGFEKGGVEMISIKYNSFFNKEGFLLDDAYDPYKKYRYIGYFKEHQTEYIRCQDADLRNLLCFKGIRYLTIPVEAENYQDLENLSSLIGIELCGTQISMIPLSVKRNLQSVIIHCSNDSMDFADFINLHELKMDGFPGFKNPNCQFLRGLKLKKLSLSSRNLKSLEGIESQSELEELELSYCSNLADISHISSLNNLKSVVLSANNKLINNKLKTTSLNCLPVYVEHLSVLGTESSAERSRFTSLSFLQRLTNLNEFETNWKVDPILLEQESYGKARIVVYRPD